MSHEIRTPMNAITGYTDLALRTNLSEQQKSYLDTIKNSSNHLLRVVNDILDLSKVESGKLELQHVPFKLEDIFLDLQNLFGLEAGERGLTLNMPDPETIDRAHYVGDPVRIGQVLINLVSNALKFTDSGSINVEYDLASIDDDRVCINFTVSDTGIGIAESELEYIFESFVQGSIVSPNAGTGLGSQSARVSWR
ncbi:MAG: histidine kinase dimerization/phospho-acceptor domain-containing protein [Gammaproteobacteria bacterium]|nr:histidine kinase dimerization/phospho-acceptor domain-containing protein [Gammaproteobacteria bacterium]